MAYHEREDGAEHDGGDDRDDDERQAHRLEERDQEEEDRQYGKGHPQPEGLERVVHDRHLPAQGDLHAARGLAQLLDRLLNFFCRAAKIVGGQVGGDAYHAAHVVVIVFTGHGRIMQFGHVMHEGTRKRPGLDRDVADRLQRVDLTLRHLHLNLIRQAALGIAPVHRCDEAAGVGGSDKRAPALMDVDAQLAGPHPVHVDIERRVVQRLDDAHVPELGQLLHGLQKAAAVLAVVREFGPVYVYLDRRRGAEIEDFVDDVAGLEGKVDVRELLPELPAQALLQGPYSDLRLLLEGDEEDCLLRSACPHVDVADCVAGRLRADVTDADLNVLLADIGGDEVKNLPGYLLGLFEAGPCRRLDAKLEAGGIPGRENLASQGHVQQSRRQTDKGEDDDYENAPGHERDEQALIVNAQTPHEIQLGMRAVMRLEQPGRHHRHEGARQDVRAEHGQTDGHRQRHEKRPGYPHHEKGRHEDGDDRKHGQEPGYDHLDGGVENRLVEGDALGQVAVNVLDHHGSLVDQDAHRQGQTAQGHDVGRSPADPQPDDGPQQRGGDAHDHDQAAAYISQEEQNTGAGQDRPDAALEDQTPDRLGHVDRLVELEAYLNVSRQELPHVGQLILDAVDHGKRRGCGLFGYGHVNGASPVDERITGEDVCGVLNLGDVAQVDGSAGLLLLDGNGAQILYVGHYGIDNAHSLQAACSHDAAGHNRVALVDRLHDIVNGQMVFIELFGIDRYDNGALVAAERRRRGDAGDGGDHRTDAGVDEVLDLAQISGLAAEDEEAHRHVADVEPDDEGGNRARRHVSAGALHLRHHLRHGIGHIGARLEVDVHDRGAPNRARGDVVDAAYVKEVLLIEGDDVTFHLRRIHAAVRLNDRDARQIELGENVHLHARQRQKGEDYGCYYRHHDGDGACHCQPNQPHLLRTPLHAIRLGQERLQIPMH